jgi:hypothetical protein
LRRFRASSTTGCPALHGSLNMRESIFFNKNEMVSFYWVDLEIGRGAGTFFTPYISKLFHEQTATNSTRARLFPWYQQKRISLPLIQNFPNFMIIHRCRHDHHWLCAPHRDRITLYITWTAIVSNR